MQGDWQQSFTFLRLQPALIWGSEDRPEAFSGTVSVSLDDNQSNAPVSPLSPKVVSSRPTQGRSQPDQITIEDADYLGSLLDMFEVEKPEASDEPSEVALKISNPPVKNAGQVFLNWVRDGIQSHKLIINDSKAKIHTVGGSVFLVTPGLFQRYVREFPGASQRTDHESEEWRWVQKEFESLKLHKKRDNGLNIWSCKIEGPRKSSKLKGYLIEDTQIIFDECPSDNFYLSLEKD